MKSKSIIALLLVVMVAAAGCADFAEIADRLKSEVLQPFQSAFKASMIVFLDDQLKAFAPQMQEWLMAELTKLFDSKMAEVLKVLCPVK